MVGVLRRRYPGWVPDRSGGLADYYLATVLEGVTGMVWLSILCVALLAAGGVTSWVLNVLDTRYRVDLSLIEQWQPLRQGRLHASLNDSLRLSETGVAEQASAPPPRCAVTLLSQMDEMIHARIYHYGRGAMADYAFLLAPDAMRTFHEECTEFRLIRLTGPSDQEITTPAPPLEWALYRGIPVVASDDVIEGAVLMPVSCLTSPFFPGQEGQSNHALLKLMKKIEQEIHARQPPPQLVYLTPAIDDEPITHDEKDDADGEKVRSFDLDDINPLDSRLSAREP
jgi:hypothetical protein